MKQDKTKNSRDTYRTGSTIPPKNYYGILAALLILVTVLCSIVTVLGMMNIRLWMLLKSPRYPNLEGSEQANIALADVQGQLVFSEDTTPVLGLTCQPIDTLYRSYNGWPDGLYISHIAPDSAAFAKDIIPGDILVQVNEIPVCSQQELERVVSNFAPGQSIPLTLYRNGEEFTVTLVKE